jgi:hypothetical protein
MTVAGKDRKLNLLGWFAFLKVQRPPESLINVD